MFSQPKGNRSQEKFKSTDQARRKLSTEHQTHSLRLRMEQEKKKSVGDNKENLSNEKKKSGKEKRRSSLALGILVNQRIQT